MLRAVILTFAVVALGAAVYVLGMGPEERVQASTASGEEAETPAAKKAQVPRASRKPKTKASAELDPSVWRPARPMSIEEVPEVALDPRRVTNQDEAVEMYEGLIGKLAEIEGSEVELSEAEKDQLYRDSSTMLAGLSEQFNPNDPDEMAYLNGARGMVLAQLRRMKIGPPEPPMRKPQGLRGSPGQ